jgi:hypothetical protein
MQVHVRTRSFLAFPDWVCIPPKYGCQARFTPICRPSPFRNLNVKKLRVYKSPWVMQYLLLYMYIYTSSFRYYMYINQSNIQASRFAAYFLYLPVSRGSQAAARPSTPPDRQSPSLYLL